MQTAATYEPAADFVAHLFNDTDVAFWAWAKTQYAPEPVAQPFLSQATHLYNGRPCAVLTTYQRNTNKVRLGYMDGPEVTFEFVTAGKFYGAVRCLHCGKRLNNEGPRGCKCETTALGVAA